MCNCNTADGSNDSNSLIDVSAVGTLISGRAVGRRREHRRQQGLVGGAGEGLGILQSKGG